MAGPSKPRESAELGIALLLILVPLSVWSIPFVRRFLPLVVLQILWGILLGASVFTQIWTFGHDYFFGQVEFSALRGASFWGIVLFAFFTGMHIEIDLLFGKKAKKECWILGLACMGIPFGFGSLWAFITTRFYSTTVLFGPNGNMAVYVLSLGITSGVTALPVLSSILLELKILDTPLGRLCTLCATLQDLILWILMTVILVLVKDSAWAGSYQPLVTIGFIIAFLAIMIFGIKNALGYIIKTPHWGKQSTMTQMMVLLCFLFISSLMSDIIQIHSMLGCVLFGAITPHELRHFASEHSEVLNRSLFLPLYFGSAGQTVDMRTSFDQVLVLFIGIFVSCLCGACLATFISCRLILKYPWSTVSGITGLMVCKGVVELVLAETLYSKGAISRVVYSALVLNALVCTAISKPWFILTMKLSGKGHDICMYGVSADESTHDLPNVSGQLHAINRFIEDRAEPDFNNIAFRSPALPPKEANGGIVYEEAPAPQAPEA